MIGKKLEVGFLRVCIICEPASHASQHASHASQQGSHASQHKITLFLT